MTACRRADLGAPAAPAGLWCGRRARRERGGWDCQVGLRDAARRSRRVRPRAQLFLIRWQLQWQVAMAVAVAVCTTSGWPVCWGGVDPRRTPASPILSFVPPPGAAALRHRPRPPDSCVLPNTGGAVRLGGRCCGGVLGVQGTGSRRRAVLVLVAGCGVCAVVGAGLRVCLCRCLRACVRACVCASVRNERCWEGAHRRRVFGARVCHLPSLWVWNALRARRR